MTTSPIRVFLVDDQQMVRAGFRMLVDSQDDMEVVGEAGDGHDGLAQAAELRPDVVLMDIRMPRLNGLDATRELLDRTDPPRVIVLTTFDADSSGISLPSRRSPDSSSRLSSTRPTPSALNRARPR